jgi:hypothetical protein
MTCTQVAQLTAAIWKVARVVPGAGEVIAAVCRLDYSRPGKPGIDWGDAQAKDELVSDLVNDALAVLGVLAGPDAPRLCYARLGHLFPYLLHVGRTGAGLCAGWMASAARSSLSARAARSCAGR